MTRRTSYRLNQPKHGNQNDGETPGNGMPDKGNDVISQYREGFKTKRH